MPRVTEAEREVRRKQQVLDLYPLVIDMPRVRPPSRLLWFLWGFMVGCMFAALVGTG